MGRLFPACRVPDRYEQNSLSKLSGYALNPSNLRYDLSKRPIRGGFGEIRRATLGDLSRLGPGEVVAVKALRFYQETELERVIKAR